MGRGHENICAQAPLCRAPNWSSPSLQGAGRHYFEILLRTTRVGNKILLKMWRDLLINWCAYKRVRMIQAYNITSAIDLGLLVYANHYYYYELGQLFDY